MTKTKVPSYKQLQAQLDEVLAAFQDEALDVDVALKLYERGQELIQALETHLKTAENKVSELKRKFSSE